MEIRYPLLIDGGLSNVLEGFGCNLKQKLWSARMLDREPEALMKAHFAYLEAGAGCITTASYQASIQGFEDEGYSRDEAVRLIMLSVELARKAVTAYIGSGKVMERPLVAASIGPYGAYLADGSEYRGNYGLTDEQLKEFHKTRLEILDASSADLLACETIPDFQEARILGKMLMETSKPAWITFSCRDESHLNDGTDIRECIDHFAHHPTVFALGVNCTAPKYITGLIRAIKDRCGSKKVIVYPNSGEVYNASTKCWSGTSEPDTLALLAGQWLDQGADIIGGCCRVGPSEIRLIHEVVTTKM